MEKGDYTDPKTIGDGGKLYVDANGKIRYIHKSEHGPLDSDTAGTLVPDGSMVEIDDTDSPYTITDSSPDLIIADTTSGAITVNWPTLADNQTREIEVKNVGDAGNDVTAEGEGAEEIDGETSQLISDREGMRTKGQSTEWSII